MFLHSNIHELISRAEKFELNSSDDDSPYLRHCMNLIRYAKVHGESVNTNMATIASLLDYKKLFTQYREKGTITFGEKDLLCNEYSDDGSDTYENQYLFYKLAELMSKRKIIYMFMDLTNYFIQEYDDGTHEQLSHSVSYVLYPTRKGRYNMYYINSHGDSVKTYKSYEYMLSSTRYKDVAIPEKDVCMEFMVNNAIVQSLNDYLDNYCHEQVVSYTATHNYNYLHFNLQGGDNHGTCFVFPYVLWYELMFGFKEEYVCGSRSRVRSPYYFPNGNTPTMTLKDTLDGKNIQRLMELIYSKYDSQLEYIIQSNFYKRLAIRTSKINKNIEARKAYFTKAILYKMVYRFELAHEFVEKTSKETTKAL